MNKVLTIGGSEIQKTVKSMNVKMPDDLPPIYTDEGAFEQVLLNLLINASQAADKHDAYIKVRMRLRGYNEEFLSIKVHDNGCGMDEATREKIFDPFFSTKSLEGGTGLGLYITRKLVQGLNGQISVTSRLGKGSCFSVMLPCSNPETETKFDLHTFSS